METILIIIEIALFCYIAYVALYTLIFALGGHFYRSPVLKNNFGEKRFAVLIPAYKEDNVIYSVAREALNQDYHPRNYDIIVIADSLQSSTLDELKTLPVITVEVKFKKSTKVKAMNEAMKRIGDDYDYAVVVDADNVMDRRFLKTVNDLHQQGYTAIQGRRAAKNENNTLSFLDGLSEEINNHIYGKGSTALGLSSVLKGSGMSFRYKILKSLLSKMNAIGGFDRELELRLVSKGIKVKYASNAMIYDEKVEEPKVFENQRKRWISSQYFYLRKYFFSGFISLFRGRFAYFNSTVLRNIQLPRLINLGLITSCTALLFFIQSELTVPYLVWVLSWTAMVMGTILAIPRAYYNVRLLNSIFRLPVIFWRMFLLLFRLKGSNTKFIHTPHTSSSSQK